MQISDDIFLGPAFAAGAIQVFGNPSPMELGVGPMGRVFVWDTVPVASGVALLATSQNPGSGASFVLTAGAGVTTNVRADGTTEYVLDVPRSVSVTAAGANTAAYRVEGYDVYGQFMTSNAGTPSTGTNVTPKAFKSVVRVVNSNATAGSTNLTVGFNDRLGLPVRVTDPAYILNVKWDATLAANAGTFVAAVTTDPATAATGDVRGTYVPSGSAANGARRLVMAIAVPAIGCGPQATRVGAYGVTQA